MTDTPPGRADADYGRYYDLEGYLFSTVRERFNVTHRLDAFDLFSIVIWKANRAKTYVARRLLDRYGDLERAAQQLSEAVWQAPDDEARLAVLMGKGGFALPMASAILTVLYPDRFTVYDRRVCDALGDFHRLAAVRTSQRVWKGYEAYRHAVEQATTPAGLSLRDKDRYLFGRSVAQQLVHDLGAHFRKDNEPEEERP
jgi:hypothetical protein